MNVILLKLKVIKKVGISTTAINFLFQRIFRRNARFRSSLHFTSTIVGNKLVYKHDLITLTSFAASGGVYIQSLNGITIGENFLFAPGLKLISANHSTNMQRRSMSAPPISIGSNVWCGANVIVLPGITIADDVTIGAGSVVTKSVPVPGSIVAGNPAKLIGKQ